MRELLREAHHAYDEFDYKSRFQPFRGGDTLRVFHGFHSMEEASIAATYGLSGQHEANRRYSYEHDNNPKGLFVTLKLDVAKEFTSRGAIMEFTVPVSDLESPVWPGGGYTVQGQMAQYFGHGAKGRAARLAKRREMTAQAQEWAKNNGEYGSHIVQSDDPLLAHSLTGGREYQALYVGHLNPENITAFYVSNDPGKDGRWATWRRLSREEFLAEYPADPSKSWKHNRLFAPDEAFDGDEFLRRMVARWDRERVEFMLQSAAEQIRRSPKAAGRFVGYFENYLWPKQYAPAMRWLVRTFRG